MLDLKCSSDGYIGARGVAVVNVADIRQENARRRSPRAMTMSQFFSFSHKGVQGRLREMRTERVRHVLRAGNVVALYSTKKEHLHYMSHRVF